MTIALEPRTIRKSTDNNPYLSAIQRMFALDPKHARTLARHLQAGDVVFVERPLELEGAGTSQAALAGLRQALDDPTQNSLQVQHRLARALRINSTREREFGAWLRAASMPERWRSHLITRLRPQVTYVHFMSHVQQLLVEYPTR